MSGRECRFPVAEVGLGQMGVLRRGQLEYDQQGAALRAAARLLRAQLDPTAELKPPRSPRKRRSLRQGSSNDKLEA